jgi:hypothetical protein
MTSVTHRVIVFAAAATLASVTFANAQVVDPVEFTTAFPFTVGNSKLPAGRYEIRRDEDDPSLYRIEGRDKKVGTFFAVEPASLPKAPARTEVLFKRYGQGYVLKSVWEEGDSNGFQTVVAEAERHHVKAGGTVSEERVPARRHHKTGTD